MSRYSTLRTGECLSYKSTEKLPHDADAARLGRNPRISAADAPARTFFSAQVESQHRGIFRLGTSGDVVAGGNVHGGDDVCRGYSARRHRPGLHAGNCGELAVVELFAVGNDDGISFRAALEALWPAH